MSFTERLEALRNKDLAKTREKQAFAAQRRLSEDQRRKKLEDAGRQNSAEAERLLEIVKERLAPILESVNQSYLEGKGTVGLRTNLNAPSAHVMLEWNCPTSEERITLSLNHNLDVEAKGGGKNSPCVRNNLQRKDWEKRTEQGILLILQKPGACIFGKIGDYGPKDDDQMPHWDP